MSLRHTKTVRAISVRNIKTVKTISVRNIETNHHLTGTCGG
jgi:hypothetical protein